MCLAAGNATLRGWDTPAQERLNLSIMVGLYKPKKVKGLPTQLLGAGVVPGGPLGWPGLDRV